MPRPPALILALALLVAVGCGSSTEPEDPGTVIDVDPIARPPVYLPPVTPVVRDAVQVPAVAIRVRDAETGERIEDEVSGLVRDGDYEAPLELRIPPFAEPGELVLAGGFERPGTYTIEISGPRYRIWTGSATSVATEYGWPETVILDAALDFEGLSGTYLLDQAGDLKDMVIRQDRDSITISVGSYNALVFAADQLVRFKLDTFWGTEYNGIRVPPDTISGTWVQPSMLGDTSGWFVAVRTGPPPPL